MLGTMLHKALLWVALAKHMGLPLLQPGQRRQYNTVTTGCRNHQQQGLQSKLVFARAHSPGMRRHYSVWVRDVQEVSNGVGADRVGVKFSDAFGKLQFSAPVQRKKGKKNEEKQRKN